MKFKKKDQIHLYECSNNNFNNKLLNIIITFFHSLRYPLAKIEK